MIAQEPSVVPQLTVAENVFLGVEPRRRRLHPPARARRALRASSPRSAGFDLPGAMSAGRLRTAEQQKVEILRALSRDAQLIVMDEPTAALGAHETQQLHEIIRRARRLGQDDPPHLPLPARGARARGHRDGAPRRPGRPDRADRGRDRGVARRGDARAARSPRRSRPSGLPAADAPVVLSVRGLHAPGVDDASFERARAARSSGSPGLVGAGRTELARAIFGADAHRVGRGDARRRRPARGREPAAEPPRRARDDPRVAQGRRARSSARSVDRERDALAARRASARSASSAAGAERQRGARRARPLRRAGRELLGARRRALGRATSRRCCSRGCCSAGRAS